ncbi:MAG: Hsp33 family molecular chaperone HslO [Acidobacteria bacterium]|nr:Hsp33 family molecular chaperone HslO [Acidobacteriota bacterium]
MTDRVIYATIPGVEVRLLSSVTTQLVAEACRRHRTTAAASAALGRTLTGAGLLAMTQKAHERTTVQFVCDGPIGGIVAVANARGDVRGYVRNPWADAEPLNGKLNVAGVVGGGTMHVGRELRRENGTNAEPYSGIVEITSGEIGLDFAYYLTVSEQIPSGVSLGVFVHNDTNRVLAAGGFIVQLMPGARRDVEEELTARISSAPHATEMILQGASPLEMLQTALGSSSIEVLDERDLRFSCNCSRERFLDKLAALPRADVDEMIADGTGELLTCHVCTEQYTVTIDDLRALVTDELVN